MIGLMQDFEKLGVFYLGKSYDLAKKKRLEDLLLYDSRDLVTHAVCVGMTGSGKTGLCLSLIEEAAIDGVPAILIDPKGDLCDLLLTFPDLSPADFRPWINEDDAARKGMSPGRLREAAGRALEEGPRRVGRGRRADPAAQGRRGVRDLHAGLLGRPSGLDPEIVRGASGVRARRRRGAARAGRLDGDRAPHARWASTPIR